MSASSRADSRPFRGRLDPRHRGSRTTRARGAVQLGPLLGAILQAGALACTPSLAHAQEPRLRVAIDTTSITVGDPIRLIVTIVHAAGASVVWPDSLDLGPFELLGAAAEPPAADADRVTSTATLTLTAFEVGDLEIPSFEIALVDAEGDETRLATDPFGVAVTSVGLDEGGDIRDVKGPRAIARNWLLLWPWLLLALLAGWAGTWIVRRARLSGGAPRAPARMAPARPPHEVAYEALDRLEAGPLLRRGRIKRYHIRVSEIIRAYIEGRYGIEALEMTTHEVLPALERAEVEAETLMAFARLLAACDLVKFAKHRPGEDACRTIVPEARALVDATKLEWEPERPTAREPGTETEGEPTVGTGEPAADAASGPGEAAVEVGASEPIGR